MANLNIPTRTQYSGRHSRSSATDDDSFSDRPAQIAHDFYGKVLRAVSGLTKAFFYAGTRSLLVSHWAVSSDAAVALTTRMFDESSKGAPKAEALRRSMLALMARTDKPYFAHPAFWAPFVLVGEGSSIRR